MTNPPENGPDPVAGGDPPPPTRREAPPRGGETRAERPANARADRGEHEPPPGSDPRGEAPAGRPGTRPERPATGSGRAGRTRAEDGRRERPAGDTEWGTGRLPDDLARRYVVQEELPVGGGEAQVFRVRPAGSDETLVLKLYNRDMGPAEGVWEFLDGHPDPHLILLREHGERAGRMYEVMEDAAGGDAYSLIGGAHGAQPEVVRAVVRQVSGALDAAHRANIIHHDLKPANILLRRQWDGRPGSLEIAVTDFGVSRVMPDGPRFATRMRGTTEYLSPEYLSSTMISTAMDYWALGMTVVELLLGRHLIAIMLGEQGQPHLDLFAREKMISNMINARPLDLTAILDQRMQLLCMGLLARDNEDRWGHEQIQEWLAGRSPEHHFYDGRQAFQPPPDPKSGPAPAPPAPAVRPYPIFGQLFTDPSLLANALGGRWDEAARRLFDGDRQAWHDLARWLAQFDGDDEEVKSSRENLTQQLNTRTEPSRVLLFRLVRFLDPTSPVTYRDIRLDEDLYQRVYGVFEGNRTHAGLLRVLWSYRLLFLSGRPSLIDIDNEWRAQHALWQDAIQAIRARYPRLGPDIDGWDEDRVFAGLLLLALGDRTAFRRITDIRLRVRVPWYEDLTDPQASHHSLLAAVLLQARAIREADQAAIEARVQRQREMVGARNQRMADLMRHLGRPVAIGWAVAGVALLGLVWVIVISVADALPFVTDRAVTQSWLWVICCLLVVSIGECWLAAQIVGAYPRIYSMFGQFIEHGSVAARPIQVNGRNGVIGGLVVLAALVASVAYIPAVLPAASAIAHVAWVIARERVWRARQRGAPRPVEPTDAPTLSPTAVAE